MLRILSRGRKPGGGEGGEDKPKKFKKADLGESNKMYYNEELKMWVEKGKEDEARAEKAKLSAPPPPSVGSMSAASSTTSLAAMSEGAGPPAVPNFNRSKTLKDRYVATMPTAGAAAGGAAMPSRVPLPGMPGAKMPGFLPAPGSAPGSLFRPTPAPSEDNNSEALGAGSDIDSVSGQSGMDGASMSNSRTPSQPTFFVPAPVPAPKSSSSSSATEDAAAAGGGAATDSPQEDSHGVRSSSGSGAVGGMQQGSDLGKGPSLQRDSETSGSGKLPALSGPSGLSFASWQPPSMDSVAGGGGGAGEQQLRLQQQASSSADMEADAEAEVSSPSLLAGKHHLRQLGVQQQQQQQQPWSGVDSNGYGAPHSNGICLPDAADQPPLKVDGNGAAAAAEANQADMAAQQQQQQEDGQQLSLASQLSVGWDSRPVQDPLGDSTAAALPPGNSDWGAAAAEGGGGYGWEGAAEGGEWQQQYPAAATATDADQQQPQQDPLAVGASVEGAAAAAGWEGQQGGTAWETQAAWEGQQTGWEGQQAGGWEGGWQQQTVVGDAAAQAGDPLGGVPAADAAAAAASGGWEQQQQPADGQQQQQAGYYGTYGEQQYGAQQYGEQQYGEQQYGGQQYGAQQGGAATMYGQQYSADAGQAAVGTADYQQGYYQADGTAVPAASPEQQPLEVLEPVHPQLPGIAVAGSASGSAASPTYGQHPGSSGSRGRLRHTSMPGSPLANQSGMGALLPQPPRLSVGGVAAQQPMGVAGGQADASAVLLSTPAAAGDASMLTAVRPSSPYARAVSPLSRTSTGMGDAAAVGKQSSGGFPSPSPPGHNGLMHNRVPSGNAFIPGAGGMAMPSAGAAAPWQPGVSSDTAAAGQFLQPQQHEHGLANGYDTMAAAAAANNNQWQQQQGQALGLWQQQQGRVSDAGRGSISGPPVPPFVPGLLESLPRFDAQPSTQDKWGSVQAAAASMSAGEARDDHSNLHLRAHPYDQFLAQALSQVNWRAVHFKQPGKLNKLLPWEEWEMEQALQEEAQQQQSGEGRKSPFWYRQMEFRQKLPPGSMKPSASEPAAMPSHAAANKAAAAAAVAGQSPTSDYTAWQQQQQQQQQQQEPQEPQMAGSPITPARAATTGALGAVAGGSQQQGEEPTPTSKLMLPEGGAAGADAAGAGADEASLQQQGEAGDGQQQQQQAWAGWQGYGDNQQATADAYWQQQQQYGQQEYAQQYGQQYDQEYAEYYQQQQYSGDLQQQQQQQQYGYGYDMSQWQQPAEAGIVVAAGQEAGGVPAAEDAASAQQQQLHVPDRGATWGSPDGGEVVEAAGVASADASQPTWEQQQQQQHEYSAAAADEAAGGWGPDTALDLQLGGLPPVAAAVDGDGAYSAVAAAGAIAADGAEAASSAAAAAAAGLDLHAPDVVAAAPAARISSGSLGLLESQPSTGRAAAAAAKHIVGTALENIMQQYAVPEDADQEALAVAAAAEAAAAADVAADLVVEEAGSTGAAAAHGDDDDEAAAAGPLPAAWVKLAQQFAAAADAAEAMGALGPELAQYRDYFVQYGDYLLGALPQAALEQAGLLGDDADQQLAASVSPAAATTTTTTTTPLVVAAEWADDEQEELYAELGDMQIQNETAARLFESLGYDIDSLLACCAD